MSGPAFAPGLKALTIGGLEITSPFLRAMRGLTVVWQRTQDNNAVECSRELTARLERGVQAVQGRRLSLVSGAGHVGVVMSALTRSRCGLRGVGMS